jgi:membrane-associated phospholipid phosphatase
MVPNRRLFIYRKTIKIKQLNIKTSRMGILTLFAMLLTMATQAQVTNDNLDSIPVSKKWKVKNFIILTVLITYGFVGLENKNLRLINNNVRNTVAKNTDGKASVDYFTKLVPAAAVYGLNAIGIKGKHNLKDRSIILGTSLLISNAVVFSLKNTTNELRPDGSNYKSFPSGHNANAFVGAEFLWQEYKDVSVWYGISGYLVAAGTGAFRIINYKHWLSDVLAGAGFGVLSTKVAYIITPYIQKILFPDQKENSISAIAPFYNGERMGIGFVRTF